MQITKSAVDKIQIARITNKKQNWKNTPGFDCIFLRCSCNFCWRRNFCPKYQIYIRRTYSSLYEFWFLYFRSDSKLSRKLKLFRQSNDRLATILRTNPCWIIIYTLKFGGYNAARSIRCKSSDSIFWVFHLNDNILELKKYNTIIIY